MDSEVGQVQLGDNLTLPRLRFKPLTTSLVAVFHLILFISLALLCIAILKGYMGNLEVLTNHPCDSLILILYCQAALWLLTMIVDHYYKWRHKFVERNGYFDQFKIFSRNTNSILAVVSLYNALLIVSFAIYFQLQEEDFTLCTDKRTWSPTNVFCILIMVECLICSWIIIVYLIRVKGFNVRQPLTMFDADDVRLLFLGSHDEIGYRCRGEEMVDLLDKYVHIINHTQAYNKELLKLIRDRTSEDSD